VVDEHTSEPPPASATAHMTTRPWRLLPKWPRWANWTIGVASPNVHGTGSAFMLTKSLTTADMLAKTCAYMCARVSREWRSDRGSA
jgi:hypothetical protein